VVMLGINVDTNFEVVSICYDIVLCSSLLLKNGVMCLILIISGIKVFL